MIKTLIVDDSSLVRSIIRDFLESDGAFQIIGEAENGQDGVNKALELKPDLITMDIEMPVMNGLEAIGEITKLLPSAAVVVISTHDTAKMAYDATVKGALDFYAKDIFTSQMSEDKRFIIINTLKCITSIRAVMAEQQEDAPKTPIKARQIKAIVIASSTGGPKALCQLCSALPEDFPVPIILVQHNASGFDLGFAQWLDGYTKLKVCLADEGVIPEKGTIYSAPTDKHLKVGESGFVFDYSDPVINQRPSADILFKSAAEWYGESLISVVLTGMGTDGAEGTRFIKQAGGITIAQNEASSMVYGMPQATAETGCVDMILPLEEIAQQLVKLTQES